MHEYPRDDRFGGPLDRTDTLALCLQNCIQFHSEGKRAGLLGLAFTGVEPQPAVHYSPRWLPCKPHWRLGL
jgi:hypothetical protein